MYYTGPDGNQIGTQVDDFASPGEATEPMQGALFVGNPLGTDFDPEELARKIWSGVEGSLLKKGLRSGRGCLCSEARFSYCRVANS